MAHDTPAPTRHELLDGYALEIQDAGSMLRLEAPDGRLCLTIRLCDEGPMLEVAATSVAVRAEKELTLACETLRVHAQRDITMHAGGNITSEGFAQTLRAHTGDGHLEANDDVRVDGERIHLNSPYAYRPTADQRLTRMLREGIPAALSPRSDAPHRGEEE